VLAAGLWSMASRPALLISADGALAGLMGPEGRALSAPKGAGFAAETWLQNDGDLAAQDQAARRPGFSGPKGARRFDLAGVSGIILTGRAALLAAAAACAEVQIVVLAAVADRPVPGGCLLIDQALLRTSGSLALDVADGTLRITPARGTARLWAGESDVMPVTDIRPGGAVLAQTGQ